MKNKYLNENIELLNLDSSITQKLKSVNINLIKDLWIQTRKDLKSFNLTDNEINKIIVKLQLIGLDLNKKNYN